MPCFHNRADRMLAQKVCTIVPPPDSGNLRSRAPPARYLWPTPSRRNLELLARLGAPGVRLPAGVASPSRRLSGCSLIATFLQVRLPRRCQKTEHILLRFLCITADHV